MNKNLTKEEILLLPDAQFLDWCKKVCFNPEIKKIDINKDFYLIQKLKEIVSKYYKSKEKIIINEPINPQIPESIKTKDHTTFIEQSEQPSTEHLSENQNFIF